MKKKLFGLLTVTVTVLGLTACALSPKPKDPVDTVSLTPSVSESADEPDTAGADLNLPDKDEDEIYHLTKDRLLNVGVEFNDDVLSGAVTYPAGTLLYAGEIVGAGEDSGLYVEYGRDELIILDGENIYVAEDCIGALDSFHIPVVYKGMYDEDLEFEYAVKNFYGSGTGCLYEGVRIINPTENGHTQCVDSDCDEYAEAVNALLNVEVYDNNWVEVSTPDDMLMFKAIDDYGTCVGLMGPDIHNVNISTEGIWFTAVMGVEYEELGMPDYDIEVDVTAKVFFAYDQFEYDYFSINYVDNVGGTQPVDEGDGWELMTREINTEYADLNRDDYGERIEVTSEYFAEFDGGEAEADLKQGNFAYVTVFDMTDTVLYQHVFAHAAPGNGQLSLIYENGLPYLMYSDLESHQGIWAYRFKVFSYSPEGYEMILYADSVTVTADPDNHNELSDEGRKELEEFLAKASGFCTDDRSEILMWTTVESVRYSTVYKALNPSDYYLHFNIDQ